MILAFFASVGTWFGGLGGWLKNNPVIAKILAVLVIIALAWLGKERWKANIIKGVQRQEREAFARRQAEVREAVNERKDEIISEEEAHADQAIAARDREYPATDFDSLPDAEKRILDRRFRGGKTAQ